MLTVVVVGAGAGAAGGVAGVGAGADRTEGAASGHRSSGQQSSTPQSGLRGPRPAVAMVTPILCFQFQFYFHSNTAVCFYAFIVLKNPEPVWGRSSLYGSELEQN